MKKKSFDERKYSHQDKEWLMSKYVGERRTAKDCALECGCGCNMGEVLSWLRHFDIHVRSTNQEKHTGLRRSEEFKACRRGKNNIMSNPDVKEKHAESMRDSLFRERLSQAQLQSWSDTETKIRRLANRDNSKMSSVMKQFYAEHPEARNVGHPPYGKCGIGKGSYFEYPNGTFIWLKSTYETRIATSFKRLGIDFVYEPKTFLLVSTSYTPDFYLPSYGIWIESKGYYGNKSKEKVEGFLKCYPEEILRLLFDEDIQELECYAYNNWEFDIMKIGIDPSSHKI
jgi:hypothetical protein